MFSFLCLFFPYLSFSLLSLLLLMLFERFQFYLLSKLNLKTFKFNHQGNVDGQRNIIAYIRLTMDFSAILYIKNSNPHQINLTLSFVYHPFFFFEGGVFLKQFSLIQKHNNSLIVKTLRRRKKKVRNLSTTKKIKGERNKGRFLDFPRKNKFPLF